MTSVSILDLPPNTARKWYFGMGRDSWDDPTADVKEWKLRFWELNIRDLTWLDPIAMFACPVSVLMIMHWVSGPPSRYHKISIQNQMSWSSRNLEEYADARQNMMIPTVYWSFGIFAILSLISSYKKYLRKMRRKKMYEELEEDMSPEKLVEYAKVSEPPKEFQFFSPYHLMLIVIGIGMYSMVMYILTMELRGPIRSWGTADAPDYIGLWNERVGNCLQSIAVWFWSVCTWFTSACPFCNH